MKASKTKLVIPTQTPDRVQKTQQLRSSGASGAHKDRRTRRLRTRGDVNRQEITKSWSD